MCNNHETYGQLQFSSNPLVAYIEILDMDLPIGSMSRHVTGGAWMVRRRAATLKIPWHLTDQVACPKRKCQVLWFGRTMLLCKKMQYVFIIWEDV